MPFSHRTRNSNAIAFDFRHTFIPRARRPHITQPRQLPQTSLLADGAATARATATMPPAYDDFDFLFCLFRRRAADARR